MRSTDRILTTHVGSLVRPPELIPYLLKQQEHAPFDQREFDAVLSRAVSAVVRKQAEVGVDVVSDGEYGKTINWSRYILERISGFEEREHKVGTVQAVAGKDRRDFAEFYAEYEAHEGFVGLGKQARKAGRWVVTGKIAYTGQAAIQRDIANFKAALAGVKGVTGFMPVVAPGSVAPEREEAFYKTPEESLFAIADALHEEYKAIVDAGFVLQVDDAFLPIVYDLMVPPKSLADYRAWASVRIEALNHALRGIPPERVRYHLCWGSWNGPHTNDVELKAIVDLVLKINAGAYSLEAANPRHEHEWRVWESVKLPEGKVLIPGVIAHTTNVVEHPELVADRLVRLAKVVGRECVMGGTDCGFAQGPFTRRVHPSIMWAKLEALAAGARLASKRLWG